MHRSLRYLSSNAKNKFFIKDNYGELTRDQIFKLSEILHKQSFDITHKSLNGSKVAVLCPNNYTYITSLLAIWNANGVALALNKTYPPNILKYFLNDSHAKLAIDAIHSKHNQQKDLLDLFDEEKIQKIDLVEDEFLKKVEKNVQFSNLLDRFKENDEALVLYTSGSSGPPKGSVLTFRNLLTSVHGMIDCWKWTSDDCVLHVLPLNHVHGLINCLLTPLYANASVDMMLKFNAQEAWHKLLDRDTNNITMFMAVPTIYVALIEAYYKNEQINKKFSRDQVRSILRAKLRFMGSGSAPLNAQTYHDWYELTGHKIVERYGMTEIGMALTSPYEETSELKRVVGLVGRPFPCVSVRLINPSTEKVLVESTQNEDHILSTHETLQGTLEIKGPNVFKEYLNKEKATRESFTHDGWFITGDTAEFVQEHKSYKILGRTSVDIIKSGGYKISAIDIEREISSHAQIADVIIFGAKDLKWGEKVVAYLNVKESERDKFNVDAFKQWCKQRLPKQCVPSVIKLFDKMPRNHIGKVNKKEIIKQYEQENPI